MIQLLNQRSVKLEWIGASPSGNKRAALLIPQFNESSNTNLGKRLKYFKEIVKDFGEHLDVIIIDDGSVDDSLERIKDFQKANLGAFFVASIYPNANKVGALFLTTLAISHELIILSDFDTDILGLKEIVMTLDVLRSDQTLMGCYFRMLPFEGSGNVFLFQQLEYSLARSQYKFYQRERSVPVMPGAGSCYKREVLISIYNQHSGLRSGEDREATLIGLKLGYKALYNDNVLTLTRPPLSFKALVKQRIRWNLGYIETFHKEMDYYHGQVKRFTRIGMITLKDIIVVVFTLLLPLVITIAGIMDLRSLVIISSSVYAAHFFWCLYLIFISPKESLEFKKDRTFSILYFPIFKMVLDYIAWSGALLKFIQGRRLRGPRIKKG